MYRTFALPEDETDIDGYVEVLIDITTAIGRYEGLKSKPPSNWVVVNIIDQSELKALEQIIDMLNNLLAKIKEHPQYEDIKILAAIRM